MFFFFFVKRPWCFWGVFFGKTSGGFCFLFVNFEDFRVLNGSKVGGSL